MSAAALLLGKATLIDGTCPRPLSRALVPSAGRGGNDHDQLQP